MLPLTRSTVLSHERAARDHAVRFVQVGERRRRVSELQLALSSVATRNGLALPARIGVPESHRSIWIFPVLLSPKNSCFENYATAARGNLSRGNCSHPRLHFTFWGRLGLKVRFSCLRIGFGGCQSEDFGLFQGRDYTLVEKVAELFKICQIRTPPLFAGSCLKSWISVKLRL